MKVLYSALDNYGGYPFTDMFDVVQPAYIPDDLQITNGCLVLWGGEDISPAIYGQKPCSRVSATTTLSSRDQLELALAGRAIKLGIPIIGICRGAQLMCALAGGKLIQDVSGHGATHTIMTDKGKLLLTTSVHHQMMYPWNTEFKMIAWCDPPRSKHYMGPPDNEQDTFVTFPAGVVPSRQEPEIVYFDRVKALCIQGHPEFIHNEKHEFVIYCQQLIEEYLIAPFLK